MSLVTRNAGSILAMSNHFCSSRSRNGFILDWDAAKGALTFPVWFAIAMFDRTNTFRHLTFVLLALQLDLIYLLLLTGNLSNMFKAYSLMVKMP